MSSRRHKGPINAKSVPKRLKLSKLNGSVQRGIEHIQTFFKSEKTEDETIRRYKDEQSPQNQVRGLTMRAGRKVRKTLVDQQKTKPCFVRLEKVREEKQQSLSEERTPANRKLTGPLKKRPLSTTQASLKRVEDRPQDTPSQLFKRIQERPQNTSIQSWKKGVNSDSLADKKVQDRSLSISLSPAVKKVLQRALNTPRPASKKILQAQFNRPGPASKKILQAQFNTPGPASKKLSQIVINTPSPASKKVIQAPINTPSPASKKVHQVSHNAPGPASKKVPQARLNTPSPISQKLVQQPQSRQLLKKVQSRHLRVSGQIVKKVRVPPSTVASTRTRRAPKPNPKYSNADIITPKAKSNRVRGAIALDDTDIGDSDSTEDFYNTLDDTSLGSDTNDADAGEAFVVDDDSSDFSDNEEVKPKRPSRTVSSPATTVKRGRPRKNLTSQTTAMKASVPPKKIIMPSLQAQRTMLQLQQARKRKLAELDEEVEPAESIIARNKRLNIALYDANDAKPQTGLKSESPKAIRQVGRPRNQSPAPSNVFSQKRSSAGSNLGKSDQAASPKEMSKSPQIARRSPGANILDAADSASTQDDFETMPTFTIVNIHDIINKKGDCLVQKSADDEKDAISPNTSNKVNRRKSGHTTILSEKIDPVKLRNPLPRTPFPPKKAITTIYNNKSLHKADPKQQIRLSNAALEKKQVQQTIAEKPAPRILNSVVAKRTYPVKPILGKLDNEIELEPTEDPVEKNQMVKENVGANKLTPIKPAQPRKLPPEKVFVQRQGNKLIKKITCFETWYVINIPEKQEPVVKNCLEIPLITLGNASKSIRLPSPAWGTKVTLYKLSAQMLSKTNVVPYTGDISDQSIPEEEREKYQPSCVMFRRMTQNKSKTRMPYDRAVIFKMRTFFTNIDGKNVRLIGAPSTVKSFEDIEILLELIDELDLVHEFVEPASTV